MVVSAASQPHELDVAVVGGGIIGLAVARAARARGLSVTLLERGELGAGASHVAAGMLAPVSEAEYGEAGRQLLELGVDSLARWPAFARELAEESGIDPGLRRSGALMLARDRDEAEALERERELRDGLGLRTRRLRASEARALEPALAPTLRLALEAPDDHSVDPRLAVAALVASARAAGVSLRPGTAVARLLVDGERVHGVELEDGERLQAGTVVAASGAWAGELAGLPAAAGVPVRPVKGQILRLRDPAGSGLLGRVLRFEGGYVVPRGDGRYVLGATVEERGFDTSLTAGGVLELLREARELLPGLSELVLEELGAGLRPGTPDNLPLIGRGALEGLVWATGHHRNGILLAPLTAAAVVATLEGEPLPAPAAACAPARFAPLGVA